MGSGSLESVKGTQITVSSGHPFKSRQRGDLGDLGGDFFTQRTYVEQTLPRKRVKFLRSRIEGDREIVDSYVGPVYPISPSDVRLGPSIFPPAQNSSNQQLESLGASAVSKCKPTNSVADASTFLGELIKDGIPSAIGHTLWEEKTSVAKKASKEYLNSEFGWLPIVSDVKKFAFAVSHADAVLQQYERDAGRQVRRQYHFPVLRGSSSTQMPIPTDYPYGPTKIGISMPTSSRGDVFRTREWVQRRWFSGAFTYYLPTGYGSRDGMARHALEAKKLLGLSLTPDTLWNLAPWSWAIDWFTNVGDVLSTTSDYIVDGLIMRYGYIMEHTVVKDTYTHVSPGSSSPGGFRVAPLTFVTETKIRRRANPFGFGLTFDGLTIRQKAIALALGITRW